MKHWVAKAAVAVAIVVSLGIPAQAQVPELTERYAGDGWSVSYPAGWILELGALPAIASDAAGLATLQRNEPLPGDSIAIGMVPPGLYGVLGVTATASAVETIAAFAEAMGGEGTIEPFDGTPYVAVTRDLEGTVRLPPMSQLVSAEIGGSVVTFVVVANDFAAVTPLVQAILSSFTTP